MRTLTILFFAFIFASPLAFAERQLLDRVVAVVNDEAITQSELDMMLRPIYEEYKQEYDGPVLLEKLHDVRQKLLNQLVEDRLVYQEAQARKIEVTQAEIDEMMDDFKKKFKTEDALEEALQSQGFTHHDLEEKMRRQALIRRLHDMEIRSHVVVSPIEVENYYKDHPEEFATKDSVRFRAITIKKNDEAREKGLTDEAAKQKIADLRERIVKGEDFAQIAREFSEDLKAKEGGYNDWVQRETMISAIDEVIFKLKPDELSEIVETEMGYHLFRVEEKKNGSRHNFEEVRDQIFDKLYRQEMEKRFQDWMNQLKQGAYISIR